MTNVIQTFNTLVTINHALNGYISVAKATAWLENNQVRGEFDLIARTFTGYDYANQRWIERGVGG